MQCLRSPIGAKGSPIICSPQSLIWAGRFRPQLLTDECSDGPQAVGGGEDFIDLAAICSQVEAAANQPAGRSAPVFTGTRSHSADTAITSTLPCRTIRSGGSPRICDVHGTDEEGTSLALADDAFLEPSGTLTRLKVWARGDHGDRVCSEYDDSQFRFRRRDF